MRRRLEDVMTWKRSSHYWHFVSGTHKVPKDFPYRTKDTGLLVSLVLAWTKMLNKQSIGGHFQTSWCTCEFTVMRIHYNDVTISAVASQITSLMIVYSIVYSRRRSKKISKFRVTGLCDVNSLGTGEFPAHRVSNAENVSIWWHRHVYAPCCSPQLGLANHWINTAWWDLKPDRHTIS